MGVNVQLTVKGWTMMDNFTSSDDLTWQGQGPSTLPMESNASLPNAAPDGRSVSDSDAGTLSDSPVAEILRDLARVKVMFQLSTIEAVIRGPHISAKDRP